MFLNKYHFELQDLTFQIENKDEIMEMISLEPEEWMEKISASNGNITTKQDTQVKQENVIDLTSSSSSSSTSNTAAKQTSLAEQLNALRKDRHREWKTER